MSAVTSPVQTPAGVGIVTPARRRSRQASGLILLGTSFVLAIVLSLAVGAKSIPWTTVLATFTSFDDAVTDHLVVRELRLPRTGVGLLVGAALGAAGALMQGVTRNPLADPGLLGVNAGAACAVVLAIWAFDVTSLLGLVWFAFLGAAVTSVVVYLLGTAGRAEATPVRLALAGAALAALLGALTGGITLVDQATLDRFRFWAVGSLAGRDAEIVVQLAPFIAIGLVLAIGSARQLNALALGDETATSLGTRVNVTRVVSVLAITLLCGAAVAAAGPIGFVGLVIPMRCGRGSGRTNVGSSPPRRSPGRRSSSSATRWVGWSHARARSRSGS